jgi:hypothetical protein
MAAKKQNKKDEVTIVSTKVTLSIKGKRVDLTLQELRNLNQQISNLLNGYTFTVSSPITGSYVTGLYAYDGGSSSTASATVTAVDTEVGGN